MTIFRTLKNQPKSEDRRDEEYADALTHKARLKVDAEWSTRVLNFDPAKKVFPKQESNMGVDTRSADAGGAMRYWTHA